ncbi:hypothetical protein ME790_01860 [Lactobacillus delbrueckii]|uniref:ParB N-terminal domain-containing protein n=1 Tax=Lactobacillus delbrueckii TaxID=1584 RepID=UPI001F16DB5D|nr:ParB N-terminal domain-containing protein [Lactobacillus delbrueckii]GHN31115.1 hypothetical protein ME790_01860 [Lactobacillus delbrueckii]
MQVEEWNVEEVKPYPRNPRKNQSAIKAVANSIEQFGFEQPIVVDRNGVVIVGHTRLAAAKHLNLDKVPVVVAKNLTKEQVNAYRLADKQNKRACGLGHEHAGR